MHNKSILDLALVMDITGSMGQWIELCKENLIKIVDNGISVNDSSIINVSFVG
jgi:hypothetical protein